jgi:type VI secretion system protein
VKTVQQTVGHPPTLDLIVDVQPNANNNSPVAFDVVLAKDKALVKQLSTMSAADWFAKRTQIKRDNQAKVEVRSWEWVPAQDVGKVPVAVNVDVLGVVGFANYATAGDHRAVLALGGTETITFNESDFIVAHAK